MSQHLSLAPLPRPSALIADFGHPQWPGWQFIVAALLCLQVFVWFQTDVNQIRPRPPRAVRIVSQRGTR
jgi:hypothetical protein